MSQISFGFHWDRHKTSVPQSLFLFLRRLQQDSEQCLIWFIGLFAGNYRRFSACRGDATHKRPILRKHLFLVVKKVEAGKTPQVVARIRGGRKWNWHRKKMLDALEKQLKNSKHEDGKLENFICFESKSKAAAVVVWGGFRRRGGYYGGHVRGGGSAWRVAVGGLCNPRGNPSRRQETEAFVLRLPFQRESKVPPKLCGRLTLAGVPDNSLYPLWLSIDSIRLPSVSHLRKCVDDFHWLWNSNA